MHDDFSSKTLSLNKILFSFSLPAKACEKVFKFPLQYPLTADAALCNNRKQYRVDSLTHPHPTIFEEHFAVWVTPKELINIFFCCIEQLPKCFYMTLRFLAPPALVCYYGTLIGGGILKRFLHFFKELE